MECRVGATDTRNWVLGDPLLDWLHLFGADHGFEKDTDLPGYDVKTNFAEFLFRQGNLSDYPGLCPNYRSTHTDFRHCL